MTTLRHGWKINSNFVNVLSMPESHECMSICENEAKIVTYILCRLSLSIYKYIKLIGMVVLGACENLYRLGIACVCGEVF